jgi:hypothetical protein
MHIGFRWRRLKDGDLLEELALYERIILKWWILNMMGDVDWIHLAQDWLKWQAVVNTISGLRGYTKGGEFLGWLRNC